MKSKLSLCAVFCLLCSLLSAQCLETTIYLPDSLGGVNGLSNLVYNAARNKIYVSGSSDGIVVIDGATNRRAKRVNLDSRLNGLCFAPDLDRIYALLSSPPSVAVIDCATDTVVAMIPVSVGAFQGCYSPQSHRLYCLGGAYAFMIDCLTNQVVWTVPADADERDIKTT